MMKPILTILLAATIPASSPAGAATAASTGSATVTQKSTSPTPAKPAGSRLSINGLQYYFEIHGKGEPLLLLHGGLGSIDMLRREHMSQNRLAILPNRTHYDVFLAPELVTTALPFLDGETKVKSWDELVGGSKK